MPPQITRLLLLTVTIVLVYLGARYVLTPASFGRYGPYRGDALEEISGRSPLHTGRESCESCHAEAAKKVASYEHKTVSCEICHGVGKEHAENSEIKTARISDQGCLRCHERDPSRPTWLKQVNSQVHYKGERCIECHIAHQPNEVP